MKILVMFLAFLLCAPLSAESGDSAERLFKILNMDKLLESKAVTYKEQIELLIEKSELPPSEYEAAMSQVDTIIDEIFKFMRSPQVLVAFEQSYRETFSEEELEDLIEFYSSPTGKKFLNNSAQLTENFMKKISPEYLKILNQLQSTEST